MSHLGSYGGLERDRRFGLGEGHKACSPITCALHLIMTHDITLEAGSNSLSKSSSRCLCLLTFPIANTRRQSELWLAAQINNNIKRLEVRCQQANRNSSRFISMCRVSLETSSEMDSQALGKCNMHQTKGGCIQQNESCQRPSNSVAPNWLHDNFVGWLWIECQTWNWKLKYTEGNPAQRAKWNILLRFFRN